jgi:hypothetical protein
MKNKHMYSYLHRHIHITQRNCHQSGNCPYLSASHTYYSVPPRNDVAYAVFVFTRKARFGCAESDD